MWLMTLGYRESTQNGTLWRSYLKGPVSGADQWSLKWWNKKAS